MLHKLSILHSEEDDAEIEFIFLAFFFFNKSDKKLRGMMATLNALSPIMIQIVYNAQKITNFMYKHIT